MNHRYFRLQFCPFGLRVTWTTGLFLVPRLEEPVSSASLSALCRRDRLDWCGVMLTRVTLNISYPHHLCQGLLPKVSQINAELPQRNESKGI